MAISNQRLVSIHELLAASKTEPSAAGEAAFEYLDNGWVNRAARVIAIVF